MSHDMTSESGNSPDLDHLDVATRVVAAGRPARKEDSDLNPTISLSSTYNSPGPVGYARFGNDTWSALEIAIEALEGGKTLLFSSGMAAISAVFALLPKGSVVLTAQHNYTGTMRILRDFEESGRGEVRYVDISDSRAVLEALPGVNFFWLESPTNPGLEVADMPLLIAAAKAGGAGVGVDNTFATALLQNPISMGADISMNSVTKYIAGHSDILMGSLSTTDEALFNRIHDIRKFGGAIPGPFEAWLALRGMRTLSIRLEKAQANAMELAKRLSLHPAVTRVRYPGLPSDPHHERAASFMKGFGAVISFEVKGGAQAADLATASSKIVTFATSLGGVESLWERRHRWSTESPLIPKDLVRLSVGIEDVEDLWRDIDQALNASRQ